MIYLHSLQLLPSRSNFQGLTSPHSARGDQTVTVRGPAMASSVLLVASATALLALGLRRGAPPVAAPRRGRHVQGAGGPRAALQVSQGQQPRRQEDEGGGRCASAGRPRPQLSPQGDASLPHLEATVRYACSSVICILLLGYNKEYKTTD